jgi:hypothetical protein
MEINRATTLAKVLARDRALAARDRKDAAIEKGRLADVYPGSPHIVESLLALLGHPTPSTVKSATPSHGAGRAQSKPNAIASA